MLGASCAIPANGIQKHSSIRIRKRSLTFPSVGLNFGHVGKAKFTQTSFTAMVSSSSYSNGLGDRDRERWVSGVAVEERPRSVRGVGGLSSSSSPNCKTSVKSDFECGDAHEIFSYVCTIFVQSWCGQCGGRPHAGSGSPRARSDR